MIPRLRFRSKSIRRTTRRFGSVRCACRLSGIARALYRLRLRQVAQQFNMRLEERVSERTRIARELHDTLLQSFHGLIFPISSG